MNNHSINNENFKKMNQYEFFIWNFRKTISDSSAIILIISNFIFLFFYFYDKWNIPTLITFIFIESLLNILFFTLSLFFVKDYPVDGLRLKTKPNKSCSRECLVLKNLTFFLFLLFIYLIALVPISAFSKQAPEFLSLIKMLPILLIFHIFSIKNIYKKSFYSFYTNSSLKIANSFIVSFYAIAMTIVIVIPIFGAIVFFLLKSYLDLIFHNLQNNSKSFMENFENNYLK